MRKPLRIFRLHECSPAERKKLLKRSELDILEVLPAVIKIVEDVKRRGNSALLDYTKRFDGVELSEGELAVSENETKAAYEEIDPALRKAIRDAAESIKKFHSRQMPKSWMIQIKPGIRGGQIVRPLQRVGIYVPGGLARYPSTVLMGAIPAKLAGVNEVIVCTPCRRDGTIDAATLVAADVAGVKKIFKLGGAQAVAAMAYGTATVPKVDKIVGPGNVYVAAAKLAVSLDVGVDFMAGPSEILILADKSANAEYIASDMLAQAEHDPNSAAVLVTTSEWIAENVLEAIERKIEKISRRSIILSSLSKYGKIIVAEDIEDAIEFVNDYAPEHLEIVTNSPKSLIKKIKNAGAIFLGPYSSVACGDFATGPNHILPTGGASRWRSGLSVLDFVRLPSVQELTKKGLRSICETVEKLAEAEGLPAHAQSVRERLKGGE